MKYNIDFFCNSIPFTPESIRLETSLGGSESTLIGTANALASRGHKVSIFSRLADDSVAGDYNGVHWYSIDALMESNIAIQPDIFISQRDASVFQARLSAKYKALWVEDEPHNADDVYSSMWQVDEVIYVSQWQRESYENLWPDNARNMGWVTKNGIDIACIHLHVKA